MWVTVSACVWPTGFLMDRKRQDVWVIGESCFDTVTVMCIEINIGDASQAAVLHCQYPDGEVVEISKPGGSGRMNMMGPSKR